jgi:hypothetical protein
MIVTERTRERAKQREPQRAYSFARAGSLWMPKGRRLELISGGPCGSFAGRNSASGGYTPLNLPGFASLRSWVTAQRTNSLSYNSLMQETGGAAPDVNLSGTPTRLVDPRIEINDVSLGTSRGQAKFRWSEDGGLNWTSGVSTAASVALGTTGLTANFATGTYSTSNVYVGKIVQWNDISGNFNHYENTLAASGVNLPKVSLGGLNGRNALYFKKTDSCYLRRADSTYCTDLAGGNDTPMTAFTVAQIVSGPTAAHVFWSITNTTVTTSLLGISTSASKWGCVARGDTGIELDNFAGTEDLNPYVFEYVRFGTTVSLFLTNAAGTTTILNGAAQDANSMTMTEAFLGAARSGANVYGDVLIGEDLKYVTALDSDTRGAIRGYLKRQWGL